MRAVVVVNGVGEGDATSVAMLVTCAGAVTIDPASASVAILIVQRKPLHGVGVGVGEGVGDVSVYPAAVKWFATCDGVKAVL